MAKQHPELIYSSQDAIDLMFFSTRLSTFPLVLKHLSRPTYISSSRPRAHICNLTLTQHQIAYTRLAILFPPTYTFSTISRFYNDATAKVDMDKDQSRGESTTGVSEWKQRAPYRVHEPNEHFDTKYEANCHCGRVKYQLSRREPLDSKLCHCTTCQTQHAAPFQWAAIFHKTDINFTNGHHELEWYDPTEKSIEHKLPCKVRCAYCHSPIMDEGRNMILLFPSLIHLKTDEDKAYFKPR